MTPTRIKLQRDQQLTIEWSDGATSVYPLEKLRKNCPCASCKDLRKQMSTSRLTILPDQPAGPLRVERAENVGNYAIRLIWSDGHATGIYSFEYLRGLDGR